MTHTIIGVEVRPYRIDYAIHEIAPIQVHQFIKDGSLYVPSSQFQKAPYCAVFDEGLQQTFNAYKTPNGKVSVYCESYRISLRDAEGPYLWGHERLTDFFADVTEIMGISIPRRSSDGEPNTRKMLKTLERLDNFGWSHIRANYIAYVGGQESRKDIYIF